MEDQISKSAGAPLQGMTGVIRGLIRDATTGLAVPGIVVTVAGQRTFTDSSGSYILDGVPVGKQMLCGVGPRLKASVHMSRRRLSRMEGRCPPTLFWFRLLG